MDKQEWINELIKFQTQQKKIEGVIEYIVTKIRDIDLLEKENEKNEREKN